ncbi:PH domain-containing protein [Lysinibacillus pakistanensis]|uniref:PH domain-containing protein n=1 Tax=Lysinibacillus pakistanensis TaxID=759811 RepID=UPI003D29215E
MQKVEKASIVIWLLSDLQYCIKRLLVILIAYYLFQDYEFVRKICILASMYYTVQFLYEGLMNIFYYKNFRYVEDEERIQTFKGGITIRHSTIPIRRIQHVSITQTFYARLFNLYSVGIYTAGDYHSIQFVKKDAAEILKENITMFLIEKGIDQDEQEKRPCS